MVFLEALASRLRGSQDGKTEVRLHDVRRGCRFRISESCCDDDPAEYYTNG